jgi:hypothetical protein
MGALGGDIKSVVELGITTFKETKGSILRLPKITPPEPPQPSAELGPWIDGDIEFIYETPTLLEQVDLTDQSDENIRTEMFLKDHPKIANGNSGQLNLKMTWKSVSFTTLFLKLGIKLGISHKIGNLSLESGAFALAWELRRKLIDIFSQCLASST